MAKSVFTLKKRWANVQPFIRVHQRENGLYSGFQAGITTFSEGDNGQEQYRTTYYEQGLRCDHLMVPLESALGLEPSVLLTESVSSDDADYISPKTESLTQLAPLAVVA